MIKYVWILLCCCAMGALNAQTLKQSLKYAKQAEEEGDYFGAQYYYSLALKEDTLNAEIAWQYAESLRLANEYKKAAAAYNYLQSIVPPTQKRYPFASFYEAQMLQFQGKYLAAKKQYDLFVRQHLTKTDYEWQYAKQLAKQCTWALQQPKTQDTLQWLQLTKPLNSIDTEFGIHLMDSASLMFTQVAYDTVNQNFTVDKDKRVAQLVVALLNRDSLQIDSMIKLPLAPFTNMANPFYAVADSMLYFTACKGMACGIYKAKISKDFELINPVLLPEAVNAVGSINTQPCTFFKDEKLHVLFASNRTGGYGNFDLWCWTTGEAEAKNLGVKINTPGNEVTPAVNTAADTLYFSSDWHLGFGGYDVFSVLDFIENPQAIQNLGSAVNTSKNDLYFKTLIGDWFTVSGNRDEALSRNGKNCCSDVFLYRLPTPEVVDSMATDTALVVDSVVASSEPTLPQITTISQLKAYLPTLYFPNDYPDPRSIDTTSKMSYEQVASDYRKLIWEYANNYTKAVHADLAVIDSITAAYRQFLEQNIEGGIAEMERFAELLFLQLRAGEKVVLTIKGFASPLAAAAYNQRLTLRRIDCMVQYLMQYDKGKLEAYALGEAPALRIEKIPFGEEKASEKVSDNAADKRNAVYSIEAALERRIEMISIVEAE